MSVECGGVGVECGGVEWSGVRMRTYMMQRMVASRHVWSHAAEPEACRERSESLSPK